MSLEETLNCKIQVLRTLLEFAQEDSTRTAINTAIRKMDEDLGMNKYMQEELEASKQMKLRIEQRKAELAARRKESPANPIPSSPHPQGQGIGINEQAKKKLKERIEERKRELAERKARLEEEALRATGEEKMVQGTGNEILKKSSEEESMRKYMEEEEKRRMERLYKMKEHQIGWELGLRVMSVVLLWEGLLWRKF
eukprot:TRINITY_DN20837_c0_g1_i1.p1 TRINITY_DN20837_c0_g1~~TRINITY_DN20837_c0_g1_i1.p1  ORF type:complete len:197 (+),score=84.44 TRINITY_DN20837_c0_g1_i1:82-672(+)